MHTQVMMLWTYLVTGLALSLYTGVMLYAGDLRRRYRIKSPATTGHPRFERALRVQQNTLEQLVPFLPALWLFSMLVNPLVGAILGAVWIVGRIIYAISYMADPDKRGLGFALSFAAYLVLLVGTIAGAVLGLVHVANLL